MAHPNDLTCRELVELVTDYLEGTLPGSERERFEAHLRDCEICVISLEQMRVTIRAVGALREERVPVLAQDELLRRFRDWKRRRAASLPLGH